MKVTTTVNGASSFVLLVADDGSTLNVLMKHGETPADTLKREAEDCRRTAARLHKRASAYDAGAATLATPAT